MVIFSIFELRTTRPSRSGVLVSRIGKLPVGIEIGDDVTVDVYEGNESQTIARGDTGDFICIDFSVAIEIGRVNEGCSLLDIEKPGACIAIGCT